MKKPVKTIYVVVSDNGLLCDFADTLEVAHDMVAELARDGCSLHHDQPHRVVEYARSPVPRRPS